MKKRRKVISIKVFLFRKLTRIHIGRTLPREIILLNDIGFARDILAYVKERNKMMFTEVRLARKGGMSDDRTITFIQRERKRIKKEVKKKLEERKKKALKRHAQ